MSKRAVDGYRAFNSQLETELAEKLSDTHDKLLQAGVDRRETERDAKLKETFAALQRIFPGRSYDRMLMTSAVVGFKHIPGHHTGPDLARVMFDMLEKAEVTNNVSSSLIASNIWTNIFYR